ncbi:unnamed protein product [Symbiodinium natans]|uniref:Sulfotransferase domain-containing protein n=1 Tax=Symbiodinium natans TaxID=878477 RepID=A0A812GWD9_9DINO|nr:unnamed protein product [Symbiodinium natans]
MSHVCHGSFLVTLATAAAFQVLDVGPPRTGTQTLKAALEVYGFRALHTSYNYTARLPWCEYLFGGGALEPALRTLDGYDTAMDEPFHLVYKEVMEAFPESKFLLPVKDPDEWYDNVLAAGQDLNMDLEEAAATHEMSSGFDYLAAMTLRIPSMRTCSGCINWGCDFLNVTGKPNRERCVASYRAHIEAVQATIPSHRLLLFHFSDGWAALSHFLGQPIPDRPFPYVDDFFEEPFALKRRRDKQRIIKRHGRE